MKYTLLVTERCNLACGYCYINKKQAVMPHSVAKKVIDFIYKFTPSHEKIDIGFFGGEPLLEFALVKKITSFIEDHLYRPVEKCGGWRSKSAALVA
jgi:uncharacterized protein